MRAFLTAAARHTVLVTLLSMLLGAIVSVIPLVVSAEETLRIGGTGATLGSMKLIGQAFEKTYGGLKVKVLPSVGSTGGIRGVSEGAIDIGLSCRPLTDRERSPALSASLYATTPFMPVANRTVKASGLRTEELVRIYQGRLEKWPDGKKIRIVLRPASDTDTEFLKKMSPEMKKAVEVALARPGSVIAPTDQACADKIEKTPGALGFLTLSQVAAEKRHVRVLGYNGVTPSLKSLSKGTYPLVKPLYLVTKSRPSEKVRKFITFLKSPKGQKLLKESGNLPVRGATGR